MTIFRIATVNYSSWTSWHCISSCNDPTKRKDASLPGAARQSFVSWQVVPIAAWPACAVQQQWAASKLFLFLRLHGCLNQLQVSHTQGSQYGTSVCALRPLSWSFTIWALSLKPWPLLKVYPTVVEGLSLFFLHYLFSLGPRKTKGKLILCTHIVWVHESLFEAQDKEWVVSLWIVGQQSPLEPPKLKAIATALGYSAKLDSKTLLMKASHTWRNQVATDLEASSLLAGFYRTRRCYAQYWRGKDINLTYMWTLRATVMTGLTRHSHWYNSGTNVTRVDNHFHIGSDAHFMN